MIILKIANVKVTPSAVNEKKWYRNLLMFLKPVMVLYITTVVAAIGMNGGVVRVEDFIPNEFMLGGATLYVLNGALDYLNKLGES